VTYFHLTPQQIDDMIEASEGSSIEPHSRSKLLALRMHHDGASHGLVGRVLNISQLTLRLSR